MRRFIESLLDSTLADRLKVAIIVARIAVALAGLAVEARGKALTVEFEAFRVPTVARLSELCLGRWLWRVNHSGQNH